MSEDREVDIEQLIAGLDKLPESVKDLIVAGVSRRHKYSDSGAKTLLEKSDQFAQVAQLERMGYGAGRIANELGMPTSDVHSLLAGVKEMYNSRNLDTREVMVARELRVIMDVRREAFAGLARAKRGYTSTKTGQEAGKQGPQMVDVVETEEKSGAEFLTVILATTKRVSEMFDLDEAAVQVLVNISQTTTRVDLWSQVLVGAEDPVERRLQEAGSAART